VLVDRFWSCFLLKMAFLCKEWGFGVKILRNRFRLCSHIVNKPGCSRTSWCWLHRFLRFSFLWWNVVSIVPINTATIIGCSRTIQCRLYRFWRSFKKPVATGITGAVYRQCGKGFLSRTLMLLRKIVFLVLNLLKSGFGCVHIYINTVTSWTSRCWSPRSSSRRGWPSNQTVPNRTCPGPSFCTAAAAACASGCPCWRPPTRGVARGSSRSSPSASCCRLSCAPFCPLVGGFWGVLLSFLWKFDAFVCFCLKMCF